MLLFIQSFITKINFQVIDYYSKKSLVANLPAEKPPKEVTVEVEKVLSSWNVIYSIFQYNYSKIQIYLIIQLQLLNCQLFIVWNYRLLSNLLRISEYWVVIWNKKNQMAFEIALLIDHAEEFQSLDHWQA